MAAARGISSSSSRHSSVDDEFDHRAQALTGLLVGEHERAIAPHLPCVSIHDVERGADMGCEVDLVDDDEVGRMCSGRFAPRGKRSSLTVLRVAPALRRRCHDATNGSGRSSPASSMMISAGRPARLAASRIASPLAAS